MKKRILFLGIIYISCFHAVYSQNQNIKGTVSANQNNSEESNALMLYKLANDYYDGTNGKLMDREKAISLFKQAADLGYSAAQYELAKLYVFSVENKEPVYISEQEALNYLHNLANKKHHDAICLLYCIYSSGSIVPQDYPQANYWLHLGIEIGVPDCYFFLGLNYLNGNEGVEKDSQKAFKYLKQAAELGCISAYETVGWCYLHGVGIERDTDMAKLWFLKGAENGDRESQTALADFYAEINYDAVQAYYWYKKAAEQGDAYAQWKIGLCYDTGIGGVEKNTDEAIKWYRVSAEQGYKDAQFYLAERIQSTNPNDAFYWYNKAYEQGYIDAGAAMGIMLYKGKGCTKNIQESVKLLQELSQRRSARAMAGYGEMLITGVPRMLKKNKSKGVKLIREAAQMGDAFAEFLTFKYSIYY